MTVTTNERGGSDGDLLQAGLFTDRGGAWDLPVPPDAVPAAAGAVRELRRDEGADAGNELVDGPSVEEARGAGVADGVPGLREDTDGQVVGQETLFDRGSDLAQLSLADRFLVPPFSVLNTASGWWQARKARWLAVGIEDGGGDDGRGSNLLTYSNQSRMGYDGAQRTFAGTSTFDPVLAELARSARRSAGCLTRSLADRAVNAMTAARSSLAATCSGRRSMPSADLSNLRTYEEFLDGYRLIIGQAVAALHPDRFAAFVVGDLRDKTGCYRGFVGDTVTAFEAAGARLYNEAIVVMRTNSLALRAPRGFEVSRKLGKRHQQMLVFVKGDPREATRAIGAVDIAFEDGRAA